MSKNDKVNNRLSLNQIKSESKPLEYDGTKGLKDLISKEISDKSFIVAYLDNEVLIGTYENGNLDFYQNKAIDPKFIQRLRVFNKDKELLLWRTNNGFKGRYRKDGDGDEIDVVDAEQVLFGTDKENLGNFTKLFEKRGTEIILPFTELDVKDKIEGKRVFIQTRNYIDYNKAHQATYVDCRFMGFTNT